MIWNAYSPYRWARKQEDLDSLQESDVDWEAFLMGKPYRPFDPKIYRSFRLFRDFSSAIIDQWMTHGIDVVHMLSGALPDERRGRAASISFMTTAKIPTPSRSC